MPAALLACGCLLSAALTGQAAAQVSATQSADPVGPPEAVIGGSEAPSGAFPSIVAIVKQGRFSPADRQFCGGTIIASTWILTAAHCLFDSDTNTLLDASSLRVIAGIENLRRDTDLPETVVTNVIVHPDYAHVFSTQNDIALLELATPVSQPVSILYLGDSKALDNLDAEIVGWGATYFVSPTLADYPDQLHTADVPIVPLDICNSPQSYNGALIDSQMCAGFLDGGVDTCAGDSGGPLYVDVNGVREQAGIVSFGRGCAEPNLYGIYTSVSAFAPWLSQYVVVDQGQPRGPSTKPIGSDGEGGDSNGGGIDADNPALGLTGGSGGGAPDLYILAAMLLLFRLRR